MDRKSVHSTARAKVLLQALRSSITTVWLTEQIDAVQARWAQTTCTAEWSPPTTTTPQMQKAFLGPKRRWLNCWSCSLLPVVPYPENASSVVSNNKQLQVCGTALTGPLTFATYFSAKKRHSLPSAFLCSAHMSLSFAAISQSFQIIIKLHGQSLGQDGICKTLEIQLWCGGELSRWNEWWRGVLQNYNLSY